MDKLFNSIFKHRLVQHLSFWWVSYIILLKIFTDEHYWNKTDMVYTLLFLVSIVGTVYINFILLMPRFWARYQWIPYIFSITALIAFASLLHELIFDILADWIFPGYYFISYYSYWEILQFTTVFLGITTLLKLSKSWFDLQQTQKQLEMLKLSQKSSELKALKDQLNPHFLFNSLHTTYAMALENDPKAAETIQKLSEVLRFMLYETESDQIPINKEIQCLADYFEIQKSRFGSNTDIQYTVEKFSDTLLIAPLLLMPLAENAFKHSMHKAKAQTFVHMKAYMLKDHFMFEIKNSIQGHFQKDQNSGIGLQNLKKRLDLIYPNQYVLNISKSENEYIAILKLRLK